MTLVELCVHMDCAGCESKVKKSLHRLKGVDSVEVDMARQKVTVMGYADQKKVLKAVRKTGRRAVLWPTAPEYNNNYYAASSIDTTSVAVYQQQAAVACGYGGGYGGATMMAGGGGYLPHPAIGPVAGSSYNYVKHGYDDARPYQLRRGLSGTIGEKARSFFSDENPNNCSIM